MTGVRASSGKAPPLILFIRRLRTVRRLAVTRMMRLGMKVTHWSRAIYALSGLRRWVGDEIFGGTVVSRDRRRAV